MKNQIIAAVLTTFISLSAYAGNIDEERFIWAEASNIMLSASDTAQFEQAASTYNKLLERGVKNAPLLYNLGTALLLADKKEEAASCFIRAERYSGTTWEIERNLSLALSEEPDSTASLPWYRYLLFWHFLLPCTTRLSIAVYAYTAFWIFLSAMQLTPIRKLAKLACLASALLMTILGSSALTTIHMESSAPPVIIIVAQPIEGDLS